MKSISKRLFLYALIFALIAAGAIFSYLKSLATESVVEVPTIAILLAAKNIPARTKISEDMLQSVEIPEDGEYGAFINDSSKLIGFYTKEVIYQNERFISDQLLIAVEEELSLVIQNGHRALSLMLNLESGVSDLIRPGDFVDVLVFLPELKEADRIVRPDVAKMILQSIEVLAVDQELYRDAEPRLEVPASYFITLSIPVLQVESLVLAQNIGNIKLALRPFQEIFVHDTDGVIWEELLLNDQNQMKDMLPQYEIKVSGEGAPKEVEVPYEKYYYYTIQFGDTLVSISEKFYKDPSKYNLIKEVNRIDDENTIVTGTGLKIPVLSEEGEEN